MIQNFYADKQKLWDEQEYPDYDTKDYIDMLCDVRRNLFYKNIIFKHKPKTVLDFGCGIPILSYFALLSGSKNVFAIDSNKNLIPILENFKSKFKNRFHYFITDHNDLPDIKVDCVISEIVAANLFHENIIEIYRKLDQSYGTSQKKLTWLPSKWKLDVSLVNKQDVEKNTESILGVPDHFDFLSNKWKNLKGNSHQKFMLPFNQNGLVFSTSGWENFPDFKKNKWLFEFDVNEKKYVDLIYLKFSIGHEDKILDINTTQSSDCWGNQFISVEPRTLNGKCKIEVVLEQDNRHLTSNWVL